MQKKRLPALLVSLGVLAVAIPVPFSHAAAISGASPIPEQQLRADGRGREREGREREPRPAHEDKAADTGQDGKDGKDNGDKAALTPAAPGGYGAYAAGPGMMGGYYDGMELGVMGAYRGEMAPVVMTRRCGAGLGAVKLSRDQLAKVDKICDALRKHQWELAGKMMDERARLRDLYNADHRSTEAIVKQYGNVQSLQRQMLEQSLDAEAKLEAVLSKNQLAHYRNLRRWAAY